MAHNAEEKRCKYCCAILHEPVKTEVQHLAKCDEHEKGCPVDTITGDKFNELSWKDREFFPIYKTNPFKLSYWNKGWSSGLTGDPEPTQHYSDEFAPNAFHLGWQMGNAEFKNTTTKTNQSHL